MNLVAHDEKAAQAGGFLVAMLRWSHANIQQRPLPSAMNSRQSLLPENAFANVFTLSL